MSTATAIIQVQREIERMQKIDTNDAVLDWKTYSSLKSAALAVAPLLPPDVAVMIMRLVGTIDDVYQRKASEMFYGEGE